MEEYCGMCGQPSDDEVCTNCELGNDKPVSEMTDDEFINNFDFLMGGD